MGREGVRKQHSHDMSIVHAAVLRVSHTWLQPAGSDHVHLLKLVSKGAAVDATGRCACTPDAWPYNVYSKVYTCVYARIAINSTDDWMHQLTPLPRCMRYAQAFLFRRIDPTLEIEPVVACCPTLCYWPPGCRHCSVPAGWPCRHGPWITWLIAINPVVIFAGSCTGWCVSTCCYACRPVSCCRPPDTIIVSSMRLQDAWDRRGRAQTAGME